MRTATDTLRVALLEDDALLRERILLPGLKNYGFDVDGVETAAQLQSLMATRSFDIIVLDVGLPDADGFTVARQLRASHPSIGIVMLTGRHETPDRVRGLSEGADAYLAKPVEIDLLAATLHSLARRVRETPATPDWRLDASGWCLLTPAGGTVALTRTERKVVERLVANPGRLVTRDELVAALTNNVFDFDTHRLDSLIYRLRRKVLELGGEPLPLTAVHGEGYVMTSAR